MEKIIIIGGKGSAVATAELISSCEEVNQEFLGYCIDDNSLGDNINGFPILCNRQNLMKNYGRFDDVKFLFSLYKPNCMEERVALLRAMDIPHSKFTNFIHPSVHIAKSVSLGTGNIISSNVVINNNTIIGNHNLLHSNSVIEHDTSLGDSNYVSAGAVIGSSINIGIGNFFGINSSVRENVVINDYNIIGMGSVVLHDVGYRETLVGVPARKKLY